MITDIAAKRYAEGAYLIAKEEGTEERWIEGLRAVATLFGDPEVQALMVSTRVSGEQKLQLIEKTLEGADPLVMNLARLLLARGRTSLAPDIAEAFQELVDEARGIAHATVTSAVELAEAELEDVRKKLREITGGEVVVATEVDESILGGLIVRIGDRLIDGSTKSRLVALKRELAGAASR